MPVVSSLLPLLAKSLLYTTLGMVSNDEVIAGHRLWGKGLAPYSAHVIANSRWLAEMENINRVHPSYHPDKWRTLKHYLLLFHDENFECLAKGYSIEVLQDSLEHVVEIARTRLFERENREQRRSFGQS